MESEIHIMRNTLHASRDTNLRYLSTLVERTLQIRPFLCKTNLIFPIFRLKMMISLKNKPNSNPIQSQTNPMAGKSKMNINVRYTKTYKNKTAAKRNKNKPNSKPFCINAIVNISSFMTSKYENLYLWRGEKTNPITLILEYRNR
jgi:hypothetical protein